MKLPAKIKLSTGYNYISNDSVNQNLLRFSDILDGYNVIKILCDEETIDYSFVAQDGNNIQAILGKNYRVNILKDKMIQFVFSKSGESSEKIAELQEILRESGYRYNVITKPSYYLNDVKIIIEASYDMKEEDITGLFDLFEIK